MLVHILAILVAFGSFSLYMAAFFIPEVYRKYDFVWSGIGLFYALVLWVCAGRITGGVLLGQTASVALLGWFGWQNLQYRRALTPKEQRTRVPGESLGAVLKNSIQTLQQSLQNRFAPRPALKGTGATKAPSQSGSLAQQSAPASPESPRSIAQRRAAARARASAAAPLKSGIASIEAEEATSDSFTQVNASDTAPSPSPSQENIGIDAAPVSIPSSIKKSTQSSSSKLVGIFSSMGSQLKGILRAKNEKPSQKSKMPANLPLNTWEDGDFDQSFESSDEVDQSLDGVEESVTSTAPASLRADVVAETITDPLILEQDRDPEVNGSILTESDQGTEQPNTLNSKVELETPPNEDDQSSEVNPPAIEEPLAESTLPLTEVFVGSHDSSDESLSPIAELPLTDPLVEPDRSSDESHSSTPEFPLTESVADSESSSEEDLSTSQESSNLAVDDSSVVGAEPDINNSIDEAGDNPLLSPTNSDQLTVDQNTMEEKTGDGETMEQESEEALRGHFSLERSTPPPPLDPALHLAMPDPIPLFTPAVQEVEPVVIEMTAVLIEEPEADPLGAAAPDSPEEEEEVLPVPSEQKPDPILPRSSSAMDDDDDWF